MTSRIGIIIILAACLAVVLTFTAGAALGKDKETGTEPDGVTVSRWLLLGPASEPLPAFHDADTGGFDMKDVGKADIFAREEWVPVEGAAEQWITTETLAWKAVDANADGLVTIDAPEVTPTGTPAVAWLATYLTTDRFRSLKLELLGTHSRRAWIDGEQVADGGKAGSGDGDAAAKKKKSKKKEEHEDTIEGTLHLSTGKHLLMIRAVFDPSGNGSWQIGARLLNDEKKDGGAEPALLIDTSIDPERDITVTDILDAPRVTSAAVSPDGGLVAVSVKRVFPGTDETESWVEIRNVSDGKTVSTWRGAAEMKQVAWSPAGKRLSYVSTTDKKSTLWLADLETGQVQPLLDRVEHWGSYEWSPAGNTIVYSTTVEPEKDESGVKRVENLLDRQADYRTRSVLHLAAVPGGAHRRLTAGPVSATYRDFSPDGKKMMFSREFENLEKRPYTRAELWEMTLETGAVKKVREFGWLNGARYSPDGKRYLIHAGVTEFGDAGVNLPDGVVPNEYDGQLFIWDPETESVEAISREFSPAVVSAEWSRYDGKIYLRAEDRDYLSLYRYDVASGEYETIDTGFDMVRTFSMALDAPVAVAGGSSVWKPQSLVALHLGGGGSRILFEPSADRYRHVRRGEVKPFSFTSAAGREIDGRVYLPTGFDEERKYPAIVYYYGGTSPVGRDFGGRYPKEYWAANGYVVYVLQPSGATGYGQEFSAAHVNDWGKTTAKEIIEGTGEFLEAHPFVDPGRVGCIGASYGGFMTMQLVTRTDIFAAAVAHAGISALSSYWGEGYWGYLYSSVATAGSFPWNRRDIYVDHSPLFNADKVNTPILLTHGDADPNVPPGESDQFFVALRLLGKEVEFLRFDNQQHFIMDHDQRLQWSRSIVAWFDRWLKEQPEWWEHLYQDGKKDR